MNYYLQKRFTKRDPIGVGTFPLPIHEAPQCSESVILSNKKTNNKKYVNIYIHIPFCSKICHFCGLNRSIFDFDTAERYVNALINEIKIYKKKGMSDNVTIQAIYFGGGTPNTLSFLQIIKIVNIIQNNFDILPDVEITVEGMIFNFTPEYLGALKKNGVTRVSTGVQTFDTDIRGLLGLNTDIQSLKKCLSNIKNTFDNFNIDLIYNLPNQSVDQYMNDLKIAIEDYDVPHLTLNPLVILINSVLYGKVEKGELNCTDEQMECDFFDLSVTYLKEKNRVHYSVRDFSKENCLCKYIVHNAYSNDVIAFGAGAFGFMNNVVYRNFTNINDYIDRCNHDLFPIEKYKECSNDEVLSRFMLMALRLTNCDLSKSSLICERNADEVFRIQLLELEEEGFIHRNGPTVTFTELGLYWGNNIRAEFTKSDSLSYIGYDLKGIGKIGRGNYI